nr:SDR family oxidoreductase [Sphingobium sp. Sx8-8]
MVVGGSGGIGEAVCQRFSRDGWQVVTASRNPPADEAAQDWMPIDITDHARCADVAERIAARFGALDALVNCASVAVPGLSGPFHRTDPAMFDLGARTSIVATFNLVHAMHRLLAMRGGAVALFASDAALFASRNQSIVGPTRAAIVNFTRNYAMEAAEDGIRLNCISLSYVRGTPIFDALEHEGSPRIATATARAKLGLPQAGDIAPLVAFLCSDGARHITGQTISVNGGLSA